MPTFLDYKRSWSKKPPLECNFGPKLKPHVGRSAKKMTVVPSIYKDVHELCNDPITTVLLLIRIA